MNLRAMPAMASTVHRLGPSWQMGRARSAERRDGASVASSQVLRGRMAAVSVRAAIAAGGWVGFGLGLILGAVLGALLTWFASAALQWQHELGLTLGVAQNLLPLGDQVPMLAWISSNWYLIIPATGIAVGVVGAAIVGLVAGLVAAGYNRVSRHALVLVELPESDLARTAGPAAAERPGRSEWGAGASGGRARSMVSRGDEVHWLGVLPAGAAAGESAGEPLTTEEPAAGQRAATGESAAASSTEAQALPQA